MALGKRVFKIHSVSHFAMFLSLVCLGLNYIPMLKLLLRTTNLKLLPFIFKFLRDRLGEPVWNLLDNYFQQFNLTISIFTHQIAVKSSY